MSKEITPYVSPETERTHETDKDAINAIILSLVKRVSDLERQMIQSNLWADRWAEEQCHWGSIIKQFHYTALTALEVKQIRDFMNEFREFMSEGDEL